MKYQQYILGLLRIALGLIFLWAFFDKVFGLGFATEAGKAWLDGVSPTSGFLSFGTHGPFASVFQALSGAAIVDWLFMLGLLGIGFALVLGIMMRVARAAGVAFLLLIWISVFPPEHHPFLDEHVIYALVLLLLPAFQADEYLGIGKWWKRRQIVEKWEWLQ